MKELMSLINLHREIILLSLEMILDPSDVNAIQSDRKDVETKK